MPPQEQHMFSEGAEEICPLFVLFEHSPQHIHKGLAGAGLPCIVPLLAMPPLANIPELAIE